MSVRYPSGSRTAICAKLLLLLAVAGASQFPNGARGEQEGSTHATTASAHADLRHGGALADSYGYHRLAPGAQATIAPPSGWYGYGFPVSAHRWGWFGAAHYYPTVTWHRGYMGDQKRWAYRRGY